MAVAPVPRRGPAPLLLLVVLPDAQVAPSFSVSLTEDAEVSADEEVDLDTGELPAAVPRMRSAVLLAMGGVAAEADDTVEIAGIRLARRKVSDLDKDALRGLSDSLKARIKSGVVVLASANDGKVQIVLREPKDAEYAWRVLGDVPQILEGFVPFTRELSVLAVRGRGGATAVSGGAPGIFTSGQLVKTAFTQAPEFSVSLYSGESLRLVDLRGRPVMVNFWASWCPPCRDEAPLLEQTWRAYRDRGVTFVGLDIWDTEQDARTFMRKYDITYLNGPDDGGRIAIDYGLTGIPETFFIDRQGQIVSELRFAHSLAGWQAFGEQLKKYPALAVAIETSQGAAVDQLLQLDCRVYPVNPLSAKSYRERKVPSGTPITPAACA